MAAKNEALDLLDSLRSVLSRSQQVRMFSHNFFIVVTCNLCSRSVLHLAATAARPSTSTSRSFTKHPIKKRRVSGQVQGREKSFVKDILCIPPSDWNGKTLPILRGKARGKLAEMGLSGKIVLWSSWPEERIIEEVTSVFGAAFGLAEGERLPFRYLTIVAGMRKLAYPNVSTSFRWTGASVAALAGQGGLYIESSLPLMAKPEISTSIFTKESNVLLVDSDSSGDEDANSLPSLDQILHGTSTSAIVPAASGAEAYFHSYAGILNEDNFEDEDADLQRVLAMSARESTTSTTSDYKEILQLHISTKMVRDDDDNMGPKNLLNVRRSCAFLDSMRKINRPTFNPTHGLSVKFADDTGASEGAVDAGGPTREFLRIALYDVYHNHGLFGGPDHNKVLVLNSQARAKDMYRHCGQFLAVSLCNGGGVGNCMSKAVYNFLVYGEGGSHPQIEDVADPEAKDTLVKIRDCTDKEAFGKLVNDDKVAEQIFQSGFLAIPKFESKSVLIDGLCHYHVLDRPRSALEQMKDGLKMLGVLELITQHPEPFANLFCYREAPLTPSTFEEQFEVRYSCPGSTEREQQEQVIMHWRDYLQDCQAGAAQATLEHILIFATGANQVPPLGFDCRPSIDFWQDVRPKANTCINRLYLPLHHNKSDIPYDTFRELMDDGIVNSPCFGMA